MERRGEGPDRKGEEKREGEVKSIVQQMMVPVMTPLLSSEPHRRCSISLSPAEEIISMLQRQTGLQLAGKGGGAEVGGASMHPAPRKQSSPTELVECCSRTADNSNQRGFFYTRQQNQHVEAYGLLKAPFCELVASEGGTEWDGRGYSMTEMENASEHGAIQWSTTERG